ncbi:MAG: hypothetical protein ABJ360_04650 [Roseobacter sp.]
MSLELWEADDLIAFAHEESLEFTISYSQSTSPKIAYAKKCILEGHLGKVVTVIDSRHLPRKLDKKFASRVKPSPAATAG